MSLDKFAKEKEAVDERVKQLTADIKSLKRNGVESEKYIADLEKQLLIYRSIKERVHLSRPALIVSKPKKTAKGEQPWQGVNDPWHMTVAVVSSDWQLGEVVDPRALHGCNGYDRAIAIMRVNQWVQDSIKMIRHQTQGSIVDKIVIMWLGDEISGNIHIELQETNDGTPLDNVLLAYDLKHEATEAFKAEFGKVDSVQVPSNHCRTSLKNINKGEAHNDYGWFTGKMLQDTYKDDPDVNVYVSDAYDFQIKIYDSVVNMEHGHKVGTTGGGIQGIGPGMTRATMKRQKRDRALGREADLYVYAHFHTPIAEGDYVVNGSLVGLAEYPYDGAMDLKFGGKPVQWLLYFTPELGYTHSYPIICLADGEKKLWATAGRNKWQGR